MHFMALAAPPMFPGWLVSIKVKRICGNIGLLDISDIICVFNKQFRYLIKEICLHHPILNIAIRAARQAGQVIMRHLDRLDTLNIQVKARNDFVSEVDHLAEAEIIRVITAAYPDHAILADESGARSGNSYQWIIDPLD